jgi:hypothetical protein
MTTPQDSKDNVTARTTVSGDLASPDQQQSATRPEVVPSDGVDLAAGRPATLEETKRKYANPGPGPTKIGEDARFQLDPSDLESILHVKEYARALATVLDETGDEQGLSVAIFGRWGRGKTHFARALVHALTDKDRPKSRIYTPVTFSAWKYRSRAETWAFLYGRLAEEGSQVSRWLPWRAAFYRTGPWPAIGAICLLSFGLWSLSERFEDALWLKRTIGWSAAGYLLFLFVRFRTFAQRLKTSYSPRVHSERLGLQAAIGDDLAALLRAWIPSQSITIINKLMSSAVLKEPIKRRRYAEWAWDHFFGLGYYRRIPWVPLFGYSIAVGMVILQLSMHARSSQTWIAVAALALWVIVAVAGPISFFFKTFRRPEWKAPFAKRQSGPTSKVLLVLEDLDRCKPGEMLEIIESVFLLLDDEVFRTRMQVCALVDDGVLRTALWEKYGPAVGAHHAENDHKAIAQFVSSQIEKFFALHMRLPDITADEAYQLARVYVNPAVVFEDAFKRAVQATDEVKQQLIEESHRAMTGEERWRRHADGPRRPDVRVERRTFTEDEQQAILSCFKAATNQEIARMNPRTIRAVLFRFRFARAMLSEMEKVVDPKIIARCICESAFGRDVNCPDETLGEVLRHVV